MLTRYTILLLFVFLSNISIQLYSQDTLKNIIEPRDTSQTTIDIQDTSQTLQAVQDTVPRTKDSILISQDTLRVSNTKRVVKDANNFDVKLFRIINNSRSNFADNFLDITDRSIIPVSIALPIGLAAYGRLKDRTYDENTGYLLAASEAVNFLVTGGLKYFIKRDRPYIALANVHYRKTALIDKYSFPSGHTSMAFTIAGMLVLRYPKSPQVYVPVYMWSLLISYGRPYFGMHYPSDLLAGAAIGTLSSVLIYSLRKELITIKNSIFNEDEKPDVNISNSSAGIIAASYILSMSLNEFVFKQGILKFNLSPSYNHSLDGFSCFVNFNF